MPQRKLVAMVVALLGLTIFHSIPNETRAQEPWSTPELDPRIAELLRPAECGPGADPRSRLVTRICSSGLPPVCRSGRWVCELCNGRDDTGAGVADEGRHELCDGPLNGDECGAAECLRRIARFDTGPGGLPIPVFETKCAYPDLAESCDDDNRCTVESCSRGFCQHSSQPQCADPILNASVRSWQIETWLELRLSRATPATSYTITISGVPDFSDRRFVVTTDAEGNASSRQIYPFYITLPSTCGRIFPSVVITAFETARTTNRATTSVAAHSVRPCLTVP